MHKLQISSGRASYMRSTAKGERQRQPNVPRKGLIHLWTSARGRGKHAGGRASATMDPLRHPRPRRTRTCASPQVSTWSPLRLFIAALSALHVCCSLFLLFI